MYAGSRRVCSISTMPMMICFDVINAIDFLLMLFDAFLMIRKAEHSFSPMTLLMMQ
jgi:hypothetical protein